MPNKKISELSPRTPSLTDLMIVGDPASGYSYKATLNVLTTFVGNNLQFADLGGIALSSPTNGQVLTFNGTNWVNQTLSVPVQSVFGRTGNVVAAEGDYTLTQLGDVTITTPTSGQVLKYNGTAWVNGTDTDTGIVSLNGLTQTTQTFATGTSGTDFAIVSTTSTHTFNLPTASATNRGALSSADWLTFNSKQSAITLTTTGSSGSATFVSNTLNIPTYTLAGLGGISLTSLSASSPLSYNNLTGAFSIQLASSTQNGALSSTDWNTFNNKQNTITLTTTGSSGSSTLVGSTLNIPTYTLSGLGGISLTSLSASAPLSYNNLTGAFSISQASTSVNGFLSSTDWNTFNNKQGTITLTTTGSSGAATFSANTLNIPNYTLAGLGGVSGSGTTNYVSKWTSSSALGNSQIFDNGTSVGIGTASPLSAGQLTITQTTSNRGIIINGTSVFGSDATGGFRIFSYTSLVNNRQLVFGNTDNNLGINFNITGRNTAAIYGINHVTNTLINTEIGGYGATPWMTIVASNGNVLLNTTTDAGYKLDVTGTFRSTLDANINGLTVGIGPGSIATNTAFGVMALRINTTGGENVSVGYESLRQNLTGGQNVALGVRALRNSTSNYNVGIGHQALFSTTGYANVGLGYNAGYDLTTGVKNLILGGGQNGITTGSYNTIIGQDITGLSASLSNTIILADGQGNQRLYIDNTGRAYLNGVSSATPTTGILEATDGSGTNIAGAELRFQGGQGTGTGVGGALTFYTSPAGTTGSSLNTAVERMRIDNGGNVAIGTTSLTPDRKLTLFGSSSVYINIKTSTNSYTIGTNPDFVIYDDTNGEYKFQIKATTGTTQILSAKTTSTSILESLAPNLANGNLAYISVGNTFTTNNNVSLAFYKAGNGSTSNRFGIYFNGSSELFTVFASGNAAIGTTTDAGYRLDCNGTSRFQSLVTINNPVSNRMLLLDNYSTNTWFQEFRNDEGTYGGVGIRFRTGLVNRFIMGYSNTSSQFYLYKEATSENLLTIDYSTLSTTFYKGLNITGGSVGIGTTSPAYPLDVVGRINGTTSSVGTMLSLSGANNTSLSLYNDASGRAFIEVYGNTAATGQAGAYFTANGYQEAWFNVVSRQASTGNKFWRFGNYGQGNYFAIQKLDDAATTIVSTALTIFSGTSNISINSTTDAGYKLDVNGTARVQNTLTVTSNASDNVGLVVDPSTSGNSIIRFKRTATNKYTTFEYLTNNVARWAFGLRETVDEDFHIYNHAAANDVFRITNNTGLVSIGSSAASYKLDVTGDLRSTTSAYFATSSGSVGIGTTSPNASALLDLTSTTKGFAPPRMTNAQMTAIATPASGLMVYDTTNNKLNYYNGTAWTAL